MLTNKKIGIRVFALVLALLMTVAVFAGCSAAEDEQARADAEAAQKAADEAKKSADSLAKDLAEKLDELNKALDKVNDNVDSVGDKVEQGDKDLQGQIDKWHNGETTEDPDQMTKPDQDKVTNEVSEKVLARFTELKNKYLVTRKTWYTTENLAALNEIFEKAAFELYRVTDSNGVEALLAEAEVKANAVADVVSDANAVQALIAKFGDVPATLYTTNEGMVKEARAAFDKWVNDYAACFFTANGFTALAKKADGTVDVSATGERRLADFARSVTDSLIYINANYNANGLLYAEDKIEHLYKYAEDAIKNEMIAQLIISGNNGTGMTEANAKAVVDILFDETASIFEVDSALKQYKTVKALVEKTNPTYATCKKNATIIEECYEQYRIFWSANGGDDKPVADANGLLTGEQFVKLYVLCLYDGELIEYENLVFKYLYDEFVPFFMNTGNTSTLKTQTGWKLSLNEKYTENYDSNDYWSALKTTSDSSVVTLGVGFDAITVYVDGTANANTIPADGQKIEREFQRVIGAYNAQVLAMDYSSDFKGKKSLEDAYVEIDKIVAKAIVDMVDVWYDNVLVPYINTYVERDTALYSGYNNTRSDVYATHDKSFYTQVSKLVTAATAELANLSFNSYEDLKIADNRVFIAVEQYNAIEGIELNKTLGAKTSSDNSAFGLILSSANAILDTGILAYDNVLVDLAAAKTVHDTATEYAKKLDELVGIGELDNKTWKWSTVSQLIDDYGGKYELVVGKDNYKVEEVYNKLTAARDTAVADILSVKLLNDDGTLAIDKETYAALDAKGNAWYHKNATTFGSMTTTAKGNYAVQVVVDPQIVAEYIMVEKFAKGADAVVLAFCDATRETINSSLSKALDDWTKNYFGDLDHVKLEPDMKSYIEYLEALTDFAGVGSSFKTASFSLKNQPLDNTTSKKTRQVPKTSKKVTTWTLHIYEMAKNTDEVTGLRNSADKASWYYMTKASLDTYFDIKNGTVVNDGLTYVQQLSYKKDSLRNGETPASVELATPGTRYSPINYLYNMVTGTVKDGKFITGLEPLYPYELNNEHTALYLYRLAQVKDAVTAKVAAINLLDCEGGMKNGAGTVEDAYKSALAALEAIMKQYSNDDSDKLDASKSQDDFSLPIAYQRYYTGTYDWTYYNK